MISMSTPCLEERPRTSRSKSSTDQTGLRLLSRITSPSRSPARSADSPAPPPRPPRLFQCSADADPPALTRQIYGADLLSAAFLFDLALLGHRFCLYHVLAMLTHPVRAGFKGSDPFVCPAPRFQTPPLWSNRTLAHRYRPDAGNVPSFLAWSRNEGVA